MKWMKLSAGFAVLALVVGGGYALLSSEEVTAGHTLEDGCNDLTDGDVVVTISSSGFDAQFVPSCVIVENQQQITWENEDDDAHNPGDTGTGDADSPQDPGCFATNSETGHDLRPGETYSIELFFDKSEEKLYRTASWDNGGQLSDQELEDSPLPGPAEPCPDDVWEYTDDSKDTIRIEYVCHIHQFTMHGVIQMRI